MGYHCRTNSASLAHIFHESPSSTPQLQKDSKTVDEDTQGCYLRKGPAVEKVCIHWISVLSVFISCSSLSVNCCGALPCLNEFGSDLCRIKVEQKQEEAEMSSENGEADGAISPVWVAICPEVI